MSVFVNHEALARRKARLEKQAEEKASKTNQNDKFQDDLKAKYSGSNPDDLFKNPDFVKDALRNIFK